MADNNQQAAREWLLVPRELLSALLKRDGFRYFNGGCRCVNHSRKAEREYEAGACPHQRIAAILAAPPRPTQERSDEG